MAYVPLRVSIPEPCREHWDAMPAVDDRQRHCAHCAENVYDFTWMTDREIHRFLMANPGRLCGRFRNDQLDRPLRAVVPRSGKLRALAAAGGLLLSAGLAAAPATDGPPPAPVSYAGMGTGNADAATTPERDTIFSGTVIDADSGDSLIGASVWIAGTTTGTRTDITGGFSLSVGAGDTIVISYTGFVSQKVVVEQGDIAPGAGRTIRLRPDTTLLEEVIVIAGGLTRYDVTMGGYYTSGQDIQRNPPPADRTLTPLEAAVVAPNPFTDRLTVEMFPTGPGQLEAKLFDVGGQLLRRWPARAFGTGHAYLEFSLGDLVLPPSSYFLRLLDDRGTLESRVVVRQ